MMSEMLSMQKTIDDYGRQIKEQGERKDSKRDT